MKKRIEWIILVFVVVAIIGGSMVFTSCSSRPQESEQLISVPSSAGEEEEADVSVDEQQPKEEPTKGEPAKEESSERVADHPDVTSEETKPVDEKGDKSLPTKSYQGNWIVTEEIPTGGISALSQEEIDQLLGTAISYEDDTFISGDTSVSAPEYQESVVTAEEFAEENNNRVTFSTLGIEKEKAERVVIANADSLGDWFLVKDDSQLIVVKDGVFFRVQRN